MRTHILSWLDLNQITAFVGAYKKNKIDYSLMSYMSVWVSIFLTGALSVAQA